MSEWRIARGLLAFVVAGALAFPTLYWIAITIAPNRTSDGHPVMPMGQVAFALVFSPVAAAIAAYFAARPPRAPPSIEP